jgi:hypothetical protein
MDITYEFLSESLYCYSLPSSDDNLDHKTLLPKSEFTLFLYFSQLGNECGEICLLYVVLLNR